MKSENWFIAEFALALFILGFASFFFVPAYEKGVWFVAGAFSVALTAIMSYKFGKNMPQQTTDPKPGQDTQSETMLKTAPTPPSPPVAPAPEPKPLPLH
jgi:hypothetical protein